MKFDDCLKLAKWLKLEDCENAAGDLHLHSWKLKVKGFSPGEIRNGVKWKAIEYLKIKIREDKVILRGIQDLETVPDPKIYYDFALEFVLNNIKDTNERKVFFLLSLGYTVREIAKELGLSRSKISRLINKIRQYHIE